MRMIITLLYLMIALVGSTPITDQSDLQMVQIPRHSNNVNHRTKLNDIPRHLLEEHIFPYLSTDDASNLMSAQHDHIKSILKIWNPRRRLKLLKEALARVDPAFEDNYLLRYSAAKGMKDIVELLLQYPSVDPTAKDNWALILARENKHKEVYNLLVQQTVEHDIESGLMNRPTSSYALLLDIIRSKANVNWKAAQQCKELILLLETSTKILPYLEGVLVETIRLGRTDLAKIMLFFVSFDKSYFNHKVFLRQLAAGNSIFDIRKIDPFARNLESVLLQAIRSENVELANLILDKGLKWNPFSLFMCNNLYKQRQDNLESAITVAGTDRGPGMDLVVKRVRKVLNCQSIYETVISVLITNAMFIGSITALCTAFGLLHD